MQIEENSIDVWIIDVRKYSGDLMKYFICLSDDEKLKAQNYLYYKDKCSYIVTHYYLRRILSKYLNVGIEVVRYFKNRYGKPFIVNQQNALNIRFNISHTDWYSAIIVGRKYDNGVDIETIRMLIEYEKIANKYFARVEYNQLSATPKENQLLAFYKGWTRKESYIKAIGTGLSMPLNTFEVSLDNDRQPLLLPTIADPCIKNWKIVPLNCFGIPSLVGAMTVSTKVNDFSYAII